MWLVHERRGSAGDLHGLDVLGEPASVWRMVPTAPAIVLGSSQRDDVVDPAAVERLGLEVCRRRSGGGLVLLGEDTVWIDVVVPVGDSRWSDDVDHAFHWLGDAWVEALAAHGVDAHAHRGAPQCRGAGRVVCFAGVGSGEVLVGDRKVVGLSQRRDRRGARFQCVVHRRWDPAPLLSLVAHGVTDETGHAAIEDRLRHHAAAVEDVDDVVDALLLRITS